MTKNVSGRLLVGLRYWNEIDEAGVSTWRFESRDAEGMKLVNPGESALFWYTVYGALLAWIALALVALARFSFEYLLICVVAVVLGMANAVGYTKCSKTAGEHHLLRANNPPEQHPPQARVMTNCKSAA